MTEISPEILRKLLRYDPSTGYLFWRDRDLSSFKSEGAAKAWSKKYAGKRALANVHNEGYLRGTVLYHSIKAHRAAWAIHFGVFPKGCVDHINGNKSDNRISNLRDVGQEQNQRNAQLRADSKSGVRGVTWDRAASKWVVQITVQRSRRHIGYFNSIEEAAAARRDAERLHWPDPQDRYRTEVLGQNRRKN